MHKSDQYINVYAYYHLNRCENGVGCSNQDFLLNLRYIYVENLVGSETVTKYITKLLSETLWNFFSLKTFLRSLVAAEREKIKLEKRFAEVLKIWNCTKIALPEEEKNYQLKQLKVVFFKVVNVL